MHAAPHPPPAPTHCSSSRPTPSVRTAGQPPTPPHLSSKSARGFMIRAHQPVGLRCPSNCVYCRAPPPCTPTHTLVSSPLSPTGERPTAAHASCLWWTQTPATLVSPPPRPPLWRRAARCPMGPLALRRSRARCCCSCSCSCSRTRVCRHGDAAASARRSRVPVRQGGRGHAQRVCSQDDLPRAHAQSVIACARVD